MTNAIQKKQDSCVVKVKAMLEKNKSAMIASLPKGFDNYERMTRSVINAISTTPALSQCTPTSLFLSIVKGFSLGLEPNGLLGHGYLVPFKDKGVMKAQFMPGYRGLIDLARRTGEISEIYATEVYEKDFLEVSLGTNKELIHKPEAFGDRGKILGWYAVFKLKDGSVDFETMSRDEVDAIRKISKAGNSNFSPWNSGHYNEMARKTVIKKLLKRAPQSIETAQAVDADNKAAMGEDQDGGDIIDIVGGEVEPDPADSKTQRLAQSLGADEIPGAESVDIEGMRKAFHAKGVERFGKGWDAARKEFCKDCSVDSSNDMTPEQLQYCLDEMDAN